MRELMGYITEDDYQPETPQEYAKRLAEDKQQQAAMNNAGYANENGVPEKLVAGGGTFWGGGDSRPQASVSDGSAKASNRASWDDGSVNHPKYGGTVAKKPQMLPGLTPIGAAENIRGGSTQNGTGMLYNKNNPNKMTKNGINLGASAYNYNKGQNGTVNMSDMLAGNNSNGQTNARNTPEGLQEFLEEHPDFILPNGVDSKTLNQLREQYLTTKKGGEGVSAGWETVSSEKKTDVSLDIMNGLKNMALDGLDTSSISVDMGNGKSYTPSASGQAAVAELVLGAINLAFDAIKVTDSVTEKQVQNAGTEDEKTRTVVKLGSSDDRIMKYGLKPNVINSMVARSADQNGVTSDDGPRKYYELITGEKPAANRSYDVLVTYSEDYIKDPYYGAYIIDQNGTCAFHPYIEGVTITLIEYDGVKRTKEINMVDDCFSKQ
ncbi:MAG: hypothetical protein VB082_08105 [Christensenella sp.]|nr:hypothetical protein [Christensenella sp.]